MRRWLATTAAMMMAVTGFATVAGATHGPHPSSETPGSNVAVLFSPIADEKPAAAELDAVKAAVEVQNYTVERYDDRANAKGKPTAATFKSILGGSRGILFAVTHGGTTPAPAERPFLIVERVANNAACQQVVAAYVTAKTFVKGDLDCTAQGEVVMWDTAIKNYFKDN